MTIEVYNSDSSTTFLEKSDLKGKKLLKETEKNVKLVTEIQCEDMDDCMVKYYDFMGWGPYVPFTD